MRFIGDIFYIVYNYNIPWVRIELTSLRLQYSALTTKQPRLVIENKKDKIKLLKIYTYNPYFLRTSFKFVLSPFYDDR